MSTVTFRRALSFPRQTEGDPMGGSRSRNIRVSEASRPIMPRHARLKFDEVRRRWVILAPERVLAPDEIAVEILQLCDGARSVEQMIDQLAAKYAAERAAIGTDVIAMLQDLADKGFLTEAREKTS
jgi:pyrroloquinoline quinone biosynthesis protein D